MANTQPRPTKGTTPSDFGQHPAPNCKPMIGQSRPAANMAPGLSKAFRRLSRGK